MAKRKSKNFLKKAAIGTAVGTLGIATGAVAGPLAGVGVGVGTSVGLVPMAKINKYYQESLTDRTFKIITDYAKSLGIKGRVTDKEIVKLGFNELIKDFQTGETVYTQDVQYELAQAYNDALVSKDFSRFLNIISHKEEKMDRRGDDDFENALNSLLDSNKHTDTYSSKVKALGSLVDTKFFKSGKLTRNIKRAKGNKVNQEDFWKLLTSANYTENIMKEAAPHIGTLREAQNSLLRSGAGLNNGGEVKPASKREDLLERMGVAIDKTSNNFNVFRDIKGRAISDITLESVLNGQQVPNYLFRDMNAPTEEQEENKASEPNYNKRGFLSSDRYLSNNGLKAQMMAGKQTYSVLVAPLIKGEMGLIDHDIRNITGEEINGLEGILNLDENETYSDMIKRISSYGTFMSDLLRPEDNLDYKKLSKAQGAEIPYGTVLQSNLIQWLQASSREDYNSKLSALAKMINNNCIIQGAYAEKDSGDFLKSLLVATSNRSLGMYEACELQDETGGREANYNADNKIYSSQNKRLYLPLTLVTDNGVYTTRVEFTEEIDNLLVNGDANRKELIDIAIKSLPDKIGANFRHLDANNLIVGANPITTQVLFEYEKTPRNEESELSLGKKGGELGARKNHVESKPCLFRDLPQYRQYKQEALAKIQKYLFIPTGQQQSVGQENPQQTGTNPQPTNPTPQPIGSLPPVTTEPPDRVAPPIRKSSKPSIDEQIDKCVAPTEAIDVIVQDASTQYHKSTDILLGEDKDKLKPNEKANIENIRKASALTLAASRLAMAQYDIKDAMDKLNRSKDNAEASKNGTIGILKSYVEWVLEKYEKQLDKEINFICVTQKFDMGGELDETIPEESQIKALQLISRQAQALGSERVLLKPQDGATEISDVRKEVAEMFGKVAEETKTDAKSILDQIYPYVAEDANGNPINEPWIQQLNLDMRKGELLKREEVSLGLSSSSEEVEGQTAVPGFGGVEDPFIDEDSPSVITGGPDEDPFAESATVTEEQGSIMLDGKDVLTMSPDELNRFLNGGQGAPEQDDGMLYF